MKKQIVLTTTLALLFSSLYCPESQAAAKPKLSKTKLTLKVGKTAKLKVKNYKGTVKWTSNKKKTASVSKKGVVSAKKKGTAVITAKAGKKKLKCKVTVKAAVTKNTQAPDPATTASAAPVFTQNPAITNGSTSSTNPATTPKTPRTAAPTKDPIAQEQALKQMIEKLNAGGATIPTDLNDTDHYTWSDDGKLTGISWVNCNISGELDFSAFESLQRLDCYDNNLSSLDVTKCPSLTTLLCHDNNLSSLDVTNCHSLSYLNCDDNNLNSLDVTNCHSLSYLNCDSNNLNSLDVTNCPSLGELYCYDNNLSSLDVTNMPSLKRLWCERNNLSSLAVTNCPLLNDLRCGVNNLSSLDVTNCPSLTTLSCDDSVVVTGYKR